MLLPPLAALMIAQAGAFTPGDHDRKLTIDGRDRSYRIHVPASYDGTKPFPVVLVFHGGGSNAEHWEDYCGMSEKADSAGFLAAYPNGTGTVIEGHGGVFTWNGGPRRPGAGDPALDAVDDVAFVEAVLDDLATVARVDPKRVYAAGMSMGAIMAYRLASELSDRIAAIATIAGPMGTEECKPSRAVSVVHFHGTEDQAVPIGGGKGPIDPSGTDFLSVDHSIGAWVAANGCGEVPETVDLPDTEDDGTKSTRTTHGGGRDGSEVVLITTEGGGHTWPGREFGPELAVLGKSSKDVSANDLIWEFFQKHRMP